jgi:hypothetical protein
MKKDLHTGDLVVKIILAVAVILLYHLKVIGGPLALVLLAFSGGFLLYLGVQYFMSFFWRD